jgi:sulfopyruvate decarboxylase TPP-binding subunit
MACGLLGSTMPCLARERRGKGFFGVNAALLVPITQRGSSSNAVVVMTPSTDSSPKWQEQIFAILKQGGIQQLAYVPDAGHAFVIRSAIADPEIQDVVLTTEQEGVAVACGAWLGGQRCAVLMQSSGVGNCVNMFSLLQAADFPFFTLVTMRGEYAEFNPWQGAMGKKTQAALELMGIHVLRANTSDQVEEIVSAGLDAAFGAGEKIAVLLSQSLIGRKKWERI